MVLTAKIILIIHSFNKYYLVSAYYVPWYYPKALGIYQ